MPHNQTTPIGMVLMVTIVNRGQGDRLAAVFTQNGVAFNFLSQGYGTADKKILNYLGLSETRKDVIFSTLAYQQALEILKIINNREFNPENAGHGIAFCVPINNAALKIELGGTVMEHPYEHDLIVAITAQGYADEVMDVARAAGATGGTILKARGAGAQKAEKFFGVTIQPEKEFLFIVCKVAMRREIMSAIVARRGMHTDANTIVFSLPVSDIAGISFDNPETRLPRR